MKIEKIKLVLKPNEVFEYEGIQYKNTTANDIIIEWDNEKNNNLEIKNNCLYPNYCNCITCRTHNYLRRDIYGK